MRRLLLAGVLLAIVFLVVARSFTERWPYVVSLRPAPTRWLSEEPHGCSPVPAGTLASPAGEVRASDYLLGPPDHVRVDLAGGPRWLEAPAPVTPAERALLTGLAEGAGCVLVRPFASGRQVVVDVDEGIYVVDLDRRRVRLLDPRAAMLENCRMSADRETFECAIDLTFGSARFDAEGRELEGTYTPHWMR